jgi:hypothetical protein
LVSAENAHDLDLSRRDFMSALGAAGTIGTVAVVDVATAQLGFTNQPELGQTIGPKRLNAAPLEIINEFGSLRPADLMPIYQLFWRVHRSPRAVEELTLLANEAEHTAGYSAWPFRARALPALAHIHALGSSSPLAQRDHEDAVAGIHEHAFDLAAKPDKEVLDLIWRTMTAALIRNKQTWKRFALSDPLLMSAVRLVRAYSSGDIVLFGAALLAWQFLLTYEVALRNRHGGANQHAYVKQLISSILAEARTGRFWLQGASEAIQNAAGWESIFPQQAEVFMTHSLGIFDRDATDLFVLMQLKRFSTNFLVLNQTLESPYASVKWAQTFEDASLNMLNAYGIKPADWQRLRTHPAFKADLLNSRAVEYLDDKFHRYEAAFGSEEFGLKEKLHAKTLAQWIPFNRLDEEQVSDRVWQSFEKALTAFTSVKIAGFRNLWGEAIVSEGRAFAKKCNLEVSPQVIVDRAFQSISDKSVSKFAEIAESSYDRVRSHEQPSLGWDIQLGGSNKTKPAEAHERFDGEASSRAPAIKETLTMAYSSSQKEDALKPILSYEYAINMPDFNNEPLNGETPQEIKRRFGVDVEILDDARDPISRAYPIFIGGKTSDVNVYLAHLSATWPHR